MRRPNFGYWNGYSAGMLHGWDNRGNELERTVALLQEQLADARADARHQSERADAACDLLLRHLGARAISAAGRESEVAEVRAVSRVAKAMNEDPLEDRPVGPGTAYQSAEDEGYILAREPNEEAIAADG